MIEIFGFYLTYEAAIAGLCTVLFAASEAIGASKYKSNGVAQLLISTAAALKPHRKEDDSILAIKQELAALKLHLTQVEDEQKESPDPVLDAAITGLLREIRGQEDRIR